mmetsp:Transcript_35820/g.57541  ORF Transcript_35820/g.57541 Transcript_35820/m.57541 type:complete len:580 (-) Transcript_35820:66-1805(-)
MQTGDAVSKIGHNDADNSPLLRSDLEARKPNLRVETHTQDDTKSTVTPALTPRRLRHSFISTRRESVEWRKRCCISVALLVACAAITVSAAMVFAKDRSSSQTSDPTNPYVGPVVFVFRDAGETLALLPLFRALRDNFPPSLETPHWRDIARTLRSADRTNQQSEVVAVVTGFGTAPKSVLSGEEPGVHTLASMGFNVAPLESGLRNATLPEEEIARLLDMLSPSVVITGMVSTIQVDIARRARARRNDGEQKQRSVVIGYIDGFTTNWEAEGYGPKAATTRPSILDEIWTTADVITKTYRQHIGRQNRHDKNNANGGARRIQKAANGVSAAGATTKTMMARENIKINNEKKDPQVRTMGSPTLRAWEVEVKSTSKNELNRIRTEILKIKDFTTPVVHMYGGYDDPGGLPASRPYLDTVREFARATKLAAPNFMATFSPHPGRTSEKEEAVFRMEGANVTIVSNVKSPLLARVANVTVSHFSTCGIQSLVVGTPHVYLSIPEVASWKNVASDVGFINTCTNTTQFLQEFSLIRRGGFSFDVSRFNRTGIPLNTSRELMLARVDEILRAQQYSNDAMMIM